MIQVDIDALLQLALLILTTGLGAIGWLIRQLWKSVHEQGLQNLEDHGDVLDVLKDIKEEIQVMRRRVNGHAKRINRNHQLAREAHPNYGPKNGASQGGSTGEAED